MVYESLQNDLGAQGSGGARTTAAATCTEVTHHCRAKPRRGLHPALRLTGMVLASCKSRKGNTVCILQIPTTAIAGHQHWTVTWNNPLAQPRQTSSKNSAVYYSPLFVTPHTADKLLIFLENLLEWGLQLFHWQVQLSKTTASLPVAGCWN